MHNLLLIAYPTQKSMGGTYLSIAKKRTGLLTTSDIHYTMSLGTSQ